MFEITDYKFQLVTFGVHVAFEALSESTVRTPVSPGFVYCAVPLPNASVNHFPSDTSLKFGELNSQCYFRLGNRKTSNYFK